MKPCQCHGISSGYGTILVVIWCITWQINQGKEQFCFLMSQRVVTVRFALLFSWHQLKCGSFPVLGVSLTLKTPHRNSQQWAQSQADHPKGAPHTQSIVEQLRVPLLVRAAITSSARTTLHRAVLWEEECQAWCWQQEGSLRGSSDSCLWDNYIQKESTLLQMAGYWHSPKQELQDLLWFVWSCQWRE